LQTVISVATPDILPITVELSAWLEAHHSAAWKHKTPRFAKPTGCRPVKASKEVAALMREYQFSQTVTIDRRTAANVTSLDEFIARKAVEGWTPKPLVSAPTKLARMSDKAMATESQRIANYVRSYNRSQVAA
jgi:hypothetical protein